MPETGLYLNGTKYFNKSIALLQDIGENDSALLCYTDLPASTCCQKQRAGQWYFPNWTIVDRVGLGATYTEIELAE